MLTCEWQSLKAGWVVVLSLFIVGSGCSDNEHVGNNSQVETTFRLKSPSAMGGLITIQEAYLKLDRVEVTGTLQETSVAGASHAIPAEDPPFQLTRGDSAQLTFTLPSRQYDQMELQLHLFPDDYQLILSGKPGAETPEPAGSDPGTNTGGQSGNGGGGQEEPPGGNSGGDSGTDTDNGGSNTGGDSGGNNSGEDNDNGGNPGGGDPNGGNQGNGDDEGGDNDDDADEDDDRDEGDDRDDDDNDGDGKKNKDKDDKDNKKKKDKDKGKDKDDDDDDKEDKEDDDDKDDDDRDDRKTSSESSQTVDLDHFFQNAKPALVVFASYNNNGKKINIVFVVTGVEKIAIPVTQNENTGITLTARNTAFVTFDPERWFASVPPGVIESGALQSYQGQQVLFIHKDFNTPLFDVLYSRLVQSAEFHFKPSPIQ